MKLNEVLREERGAVTASFVASIILGFFVVILGSIMIWALVNYNDVKNNIDSKIDLAVSEAERAQKDKDAEEFADREKEPHQQFIGPDELGRVTFDYPKTWSAYIDQKGGDSRPFEAYLHPNVVPPVRDKSSKFALRVTIDPKSYDEVLDKFSRFVEKGELRSSTIRVSGFSGNRLDGSFDDDTKGSAVVFKVRDKTLIIRTDSEQFVPDFDSIILKTLNFKP